MLTRIAVVCSLLFVVASAALAGVEGTKAAYMGGTAPELKGAKPGVEGIFDTTSADELRFVYRVEKSERTYAISYASVTKAEYGEKPGMMSLFSRKRMHYLTLSYRDAAGADQVAVFELGKRIVRPTLEVVELRTGKKVQTAD